MADFPISSDRNSKISYGRARLWLGITGVGSLVTIATIALAWGLPQRLLDNNPGIGLGGLLQLATVTGLFMVWIMPLDFLGGFLFPKLFGKSSQRFDDWLRSYFVAALFQASLFVLFGSLIILLSTNYGTIAGWMAVGLFMLACFAVRNRLVLNRESGNTATSKKLNQAITLIQTWQIKVPRTIILKHKDLGFTGGIVGLGSSETIVIPQAWLAFTTEELATAIARRALAIGSGSYTRGLILGFVWNFVGFLLCSFLPGANLTNVAGLVTAMCGFTLWSFLGLLILPTLSRNASLKVDQELAEQGVSLTLISKTASSVDQLQDDEPERPRLIETIFHPVPSVNARNRSTPVSGFAAWNVARTTLFFSWGCLGFLSRSVHCNLGRPELWTMLPSD